MVVVLTRVIDCGAGNRLLRNSCPDHNNCRASLSAVAQGRTRLDLLCATTAAGQTADTTRRHGFWFSGGSGAASFGCGEADCGDRVNGLGVHLSLGGTVTRRLLVGVGSDAWTKTENETCQ